MTRLNEILRIKEEIIFGGAIQADWYYDKRGEEAAENFVFHGPDYFGVLDDEVEFTSHKLIDTCSFTEKIVNKVVNDEGNEITLAIAGYGTGKSHLAVTIAKLLANPSSQSSKIIKRNVAIANRSSCKNIEDLLIKPNFCIVLNGMKDFNLNFEIINNIKKSLKEYGYNDDFLSEFTKAYSIATTFVEKNFNRFEEEFKILAKKNNIEVEDLKSYLIDNIFKDEIFDIVNEVYKDISNEYIRWDEGITAGEILKKLNERLCGDNLPFNKIIIIFDEFGRYLEFVAAYPSRAGDAALQQIYDVVTSSEKNILLIGFIQSDLKTYLQRVNKSSNVSRYIGRYESGEKLYLSSNIETIFANIIEKYDIEAFKHYIVNHLNDSKEKDKNNCLFNNLQKWLPENKKKGLWANKEKFNKVIIEGIYPFNPLTTFLLTSLSEWYQQRSALQFLIKSFKSLENKEIRELGDIPQIYSIDILKGDLFKELLIAEEEGRQKGEYCTVYDKIIGKYEEKISSVDKDLLLCILALKLTKLRTENKEELLYLIEILSGLNKSTIMTSINELEDRVGIINYDERNNTYDFIEDATGINDFNRFIRKKKNEIIMPLNILINESVYQKIGISNNIRPEFSMKNNIKTNEWSFEQQLITIDLIDENFINNFIKDFNVKTSVDKAKCKVIYIYTNYSYGIEYIDKITKLYCKYNLNQYPIIFILIDDMENVLEEGIINNNIVNKFTEEDKIKFSKFIPKYINENDEVLNSTFRELLKEKLILENNKFSDNKDRIVKYCNEVLVKLYPNIIPFSFDGFDAKTITHAKKYYLQMCNWIITSPQLSEQGFHMLTKEAKTRTEAVLRNNTIGWGVIDSNLRYCYPKNKQVKFIFDELIDEFQNNDFIDIEKIYSKYINAPYGLNDYSFTLLTIIFVLYQGSIAKVGNKNKKLKIQDWAMNLFNDKGISLKELKSSRIYKVELEGYYLKYINICERIEKNNDLSIFKNLWEEVDSILMENDPPEELTSRVNVCKIRCEQGSKAYENQVRQVAKLKADFERAILENDYKLLIALINSSNSLLTKNDEINGFDITDKNAADIEQLVKSAEFHIEKNYLKYISKATCQSYSQLVGFEKWMRALKEDLSKLGYENLSKATLNRLNEVIDNTKKLKEFQMVSEKLQEFLRLNIPNQYTSQEELISWQEEGVRLTEYLNDNKAIDSLSKKDLNRKIEERLSNIKKYLDGITEMIGEIYDKSYELETILDCNEILNNIELVLAKKLRSKDKEDIVELGNELQNFIADIKEIELDSNIINRKKVFNIIYTKYQESDILNLETVYENYNKEIDEKLIVLNKRWCDENLNIHAEKINYWSSKECLNWINIWDTAPYYLDDTNVNRAKKLLVMVEIRRNKLKIESILSIFNTLDSEEKKKCIDILSVSYK